MVVSMSSSPGGQGGGAVAAVHPQDDRLGEVVGGDGGEVGQRVPELELAAVDRRDGGDAGHAWPRRPPPSR